MSAQVETNEQAMIITNSIEILKEGPQILQESQIRKEKAIQVGKNILSAIDQTGMTPELDERCKTYLININAAQKEIKERRSGVTQIMDQLKKMYTEVENEIDIKKAGTVPALIQEKRNEYARKVAEEQERIRQQLEVERKRKEEAIEIRSRLNGFIAQELIGFIANKKQKMTTAFNAITLADYDIKSSALKGMPIIANEEEVKANVSTAKCPVPFEYHSREEVIEMEKECMINYDWNAFKAQYQEEIQAYKTELADKLPSKLAELKEEKEKAEAAERERLAELERQRIAEEKRQAELAAAKDKAAKEALELKQKQEREAEEKRLKEIQEREAAERAAAEREKQEREEAERQRIINEQEEARKKAAEAIEIEKQGAITMNMFEQEAQLAEVADVPEARQGYEIKVTHAVGYTQLFAFWFEREGKNLGLDKLEKTSLGQIKSWCEKHAHKTDEKISSQFLKYEVTIKAVNRK